jgi:hypothetical protein
MFLNAIFSWYLVLVQWKEHLIPAKRTHFVGQILKAIWTVFAGRWEYILRKYFQDKSIDMVYTFSKVVHSYISNVWLKFCPKWFYLPNQREYIDLKASHTSRGYIHFSWSSHQHLQFIMYSYMHNMKCLLIIGNFR